MQIANAIRNLIKLAKGRGEKKIEYYYDAFDTKILDEIEKLSPALEKEGYRVVEVINEDWIDAPTESQFPDDPAKVLELLQKGKINMRARVDIEWD